MSPATSSAKFSTVIAAIAVGFAAVGAAAAEPAPDVKILAGGALAPGAMDPLMTSLKYFRADYERHVKEKRCPYRTA